MAIIAFPPLETADEHGLLAFGGDLEIESLLLAYQSGIFPWPHDQFELLWFAPPIRAILEVENFHISKSLCRVINKQNYQFYKNKDFASVISNCARVPRAGQPGTWITKRMIKAYIDLHLAGYADSFEIYQDSKLVGGVYGVRIKNYFAAESMFHLTDNASKLALYHLVADLKSHQIPWFDCQVQNPFLEKMGVTELLRDDFLVKLCQQLR